MEKIPPLEIKITHHIPDGTTGKDQVFIQMQRGEPALMYFELFKDKPLKDLYIQVLDRIKEETLKPFPS